ncbi:dermonecrotic toxin domain-containing protein, partial [Pseudomonas sp. HMWF021]|uniref:dermonecrotic toxin domain-containing protein n=1 Tax=Pseudomonas sp. HMWF021 TaxID=2056857 RepID=UPI0035322BDF
MYNEIHSASRTALSATRDTYAKSALLQTLDEIELQLAERLAIRPNFHEFAQQAFESHFPSLKPFPDLLRCFISFDGQTVPLAPIESVESPEPAVRSEAPENSTADIEVVPPSLMDAVVRRIVSAEAADYALRKARFHRAADSAETLEAYNALTPHAFDGFLDQLASNLASQYTQYLERYWAQVTGPTDSRTRQQWLVATLIEQLLAEAALLGQDGLLDSGAIGLLKTVQRYPTAKARQVLRTYHPCVYGMALKDSEASAITLHGAFILTERDPQDAEVRWESEVTAPVARPVTPSVDVGRVLLFTPNNRLEAFDSLAALDRELHRRLSHAVEFSTLSALVADKDQLRVLALQGAAPLRGQVEYLERVDSPFNDCVESLARLGEDNFASTLARFVKQGIHADMANLPAAIDQACDPRRNFEVQAILSARLRKQCKARISAFLQDASTEDCQAWATAFQAFRDAIVDLADPEGLPSLEQFSDHHQLLAYSNRQLRVALDTQYGLTVNPDEIVVNTRQPVLPTGIRPAGASGSSISEPGIVRYSHRERTLTELALENVGGIDLSFVRNSTLMLKPAGSSAVEYKDLTLDQIKDLVRELDIGQTYQDFLQRSLITSPQALARKQSNIRLIERQMRLSAIEAKINGDFFADRLERGFNWVQAVLDAPQDSDQRRAVEGHRVIVQYLQLRAQR